MRRLEKKVAVITGAGSGIGKATAILFAEHGAKIVVSD
jgi:NAD(P)-dependent dehydrogenase (short-subunit alcohol dehydrogenase family)